MPTVGMITEIGGAAALTLWLGVTLLSLALTARFVLLLLSLAFVQWREYRAAGRAENPPGG